MFSEPRPILPSLFVAMLVLATAALSAQAAWSQPCVLEVDADNSSTIAYQPRGDRCEGVYDQNVANRINLRIAGYHLDPPVFDPRADDFVRINVAAYVAGGSVELRVVSTRPRDYFQMDTSSIAGDGSFNWQLDVVRQLEEPIQPFHTAVTACAADCRGSRLAKATLLPVSFSAAATAETVPIVLAVADVELSRLTATLRQANRVIYEDLPVGGSYIPPHKSIRVPIKGAEPGTATLSLSALTNSRRQDYVEAILVVPAPAPNK